MDHHCKTQSELTDMLKNNPNLLTFLHGEEEMKLISVLSLLFITRYWPPGKRVFRAVSIL